VTRTLQVSVDEVDGRTTMVTVPVDGVLLLGYTGRDRASVLEHIRELEALGVAPPARIPAIFSVDADLVTTRTRLLVSAPRTSGEAEFYLLPSPDGWLVGVGSDHTDRQHEAIDVAASKALCDKVISSQVWRLSDVQAHWDVLELRAWSTDGRGRQLYQEGQLVSLMGVGALLAELRQAGLDADSRVIFGGTLPTIGGLSYGARFAAELSDPILQRQLTCAYDVVVEGLSSNLTTRPLP
jgi:hypothetical protein